MLQYRNLIVYITRFGENNPTNLVLIVVAHEVIGLA